MNEDECPVLASKVLQDGVDFFLDCLVDVDDGFVAVLVRLRELNVLSYLSLTLNQK